MRIAMWSGPRNLSTALMYSFGNRADMHAVDEPFYGPYLRDTGLQHPMRDEIIASRPETADQVVASLLGPIPDGRPHAYHKHMSQHMIDGMPRDWIAGVTNVFLIRHPARVLASFSAKYQETTLSDIGFVQQAELFDQLLDQGQTPVVIDSADIRENPERMLRLLCDAIGLPFDAAMLSWPAGGHAADGIWSDVWYGSVHKSTGFAGPEGPLPPLGKDMADIAAQALLYYDHLAAHRLR
ncbi:sulfotransferase family protein [Puniceibacterium sediminis]|uniref:Branched-chain amino acid aminotransferase n=1 Tax=Puniceibacterium sediminis TaxID=1608407 RepID=A0A238VR37_9RHOB|nr:sulfotransferase family protein [Puniceibacterium sediminis]SNR36822.1 hypothetical protein SAMN06265370_10347 [Puniceibacterium sediminis]